MIIISSLNRLSEHLSRLIKRKLWLQVIMAIVLGIALNPESGLMGKEESVIASEWLNLPGTIFLRLIQMIMIPLIFTSIITGIVSNNTEDLKTFGVRLLLYFLVTTSVAIITGMTLSNLLAPGEYVKELGGG